MMFHNTWMRLVTVWVMLTMATGITSAEEPWTEATMVQVGWINFETGNLPPGDAVIDEKRGYAHFATWYDLVKVALGGRDEAPRIAATTTIGERLGGMVIDPEKGYAYVGSASGYSESVGKIFKVALGEGDAPSTVTAILHLDSELQPGMYSQPGSAVIDTAAGYAYFGYLPHSSGLDAQSQVVKIALGEGAAPPVMVGSIAMPGDAIKGAVIDPLNGYAYFMISSAEGPSIVKIAIGVGDPTIVATLHLRDIEGLPILSRRLAPQSTLRRAMPSFRSHRKLLIL